MRIALAAIAALVGFSNFFAFLCGALYIGGDAVNGAVVGGHYYVASHGKYTEVSRVVYTYSLLHVYSLVLTFPAMLCGMAYLALKMIAVVQLPGRSKL